MSIKRFLVYYTVCTLALYGAFYVGGYASGVQLARDVKVQQDQKAAADAKIRDNAQVAKALEDVNKVLKDANDRIAAAKAEADKAKADLEASKAVKSGK